MGHLPKCLIHANGQTLLERLLLAAEPLQAERTTLVLGSHAAAIEQAMANWPVASKVQRALNTAPDENPAGSLIVGLRHLQSQRPLPVMVLLADQPMLTTNDLADVWRAYQQRADGMELLWPSVHNVPGHPIVMSERVVQALLSGEANSLKQWRNLHPATVEAWITENSHHTFDLDTPDDLHKLSDTTQFDWQLPKASLGKTPVTPSLPRRAKPAQS